MGDGFTFPVSPPMRLQLLSQSDQLRCTTSPAGAPYPHQPIKVKAGTQPALAQQLELQHGRALPPYDTGASSTACRQQYHSSLPRVLVTSLPAHRHCQVYRLLLPCLPMLFQLLVWSQQCVPVQELERDGGLVQSGCTAAR